MGYRLKPSQRQRLSTLQKGTLIIASTSFIALGIYFGIVLQSTKTTPGHASNSLMVDDPAAAGETLLCFTWDQGEMLKPEFGPEASHANTQTRIVSEPGKNIKGLTNPSDGIELSIPWNTSLETEGITIETNFRMLDKDGDFFSCGKEFRFGIRKGSPAVRYTLTDSKGKKQVIEEQSDYRIADDRNFRLYTFSYNPVSGRAEILVDGLLVWSKKTDAFQTLAWKPGTPVVIGASLDAAGTTSCILDKISVRKPGGGRFIPLDLLGFSAEPEGDQIMLSWFTGSESGTEQFIIERSSDTQSFQEVGRVRGAGKSDEMKAYALLDTRPHHGVNYYRLALSNHRSKSVWVPVIAIRFPPEPGLLQPGLSGGTSR